MVNKINKDILNILTNEDLNKIKDIIKKFVKDENMELEVSFKNINYANYMRISEIYVNMVPEENISSLDSLDISIMLEDGNTYRVSILNDNKIQDFIEQFSKSNVYEIQKYLLDLNPSDDVEIIFKDRGSADRHYIEDLDIVFKLTNELPLTKKNGQTKIKWIRKNTL